MFTFWWSLMYAIGVSNNPIALLLVLTIYSMLRCALPQKKSLHPILMASYCITTLCFSMSRYNRALVPTKTKCSAYISHLLFFFFFYTTRPRGCGTAAIQRGCCCVCCGRPGDCCRGGYFIVSGDLGNVEVCGVGM